MANTTDTHTIAQPSSTAQAVNWGPVAAIFVTLGVYFGGQILGGIVVTLTPLLSGWTTEQTTDWLKHSITAKFLLVAAIEVISLLLLAVFMRYRKAGFKSLGLIKLRMSDVGSALAGFAAYLPIYIGVLVGLKGLIPTLDTEQKQQIGFENASTVPELFLVFVALVILVPITEEILVRGFLYSGLKTGFAIMPAALLASVIFGAAHLQFGSGKPLLWVAAIDTFVLSLVLIYLREKKGSLWPCIGLHTIKNGLAFWLLFIVQAG